MNAVRTDVMKIDSASAGRREAAAVAEVMRRGGLAVYPTDTFYGLGGDGLTVEVVRKIYALKRRATSKPLLVLVSGTDMVAGLAEGIPPVFWGVAGRFWPGPLTVVLRASPRVPSELAGGTGTIAVRLPAVRWLRELVREAGFPVVATSANVSGEEEIASGDEARRAFEGKVDLVVDGGSTPGGMPSTVLDLASSRPNILREGATSSAALRDFLGL
jgi:L-threonylcarbamoyladenylate synthase